MFSRSKLHRIFLFFAFFLSPLPLAWAQDDAELPKPDYLTVRLFEARGALNGRISNQLFRLKTAGQTGDEKWCANLEKAYPGYKISLLQTYNFRSFKSPRPSVIVLGEAEQPHQEIHLLTALGLDEKDKIITNMVVDINMYPWAKKQSSVPLAVAMQNFESNAGMTYFFTNDAMQLDAGMYSRFLRDRNYSKNFETAAHYLIVSISYDTEAPPPLTLDNEKSKALQATATKKIQPQWPAELKQNNLGGNVTVRVGLDAEGKVNSAGIWRSSLPEANAAVLAAAQQWEFPVAEIANLKAPVSALLTFSVPVPEGARLALLSQPQPEDQRRVSAAPVPADETPAPVKNTVEKTTPAKTTTAKVTGRKTPAKRK